MEYECAVREARRMFATGQGPVVVFQDENGDCAPPVFITEQYPLEFFRLIIDQGGPKTHVCFVLGDCPEAEQEARFFSLQ